MRFTLPGLAGSSQHRPIAGKLSSPDIRLQPFCDSKDLRGKLLNPFLMTFAISINTAASTSATACLASLEAVISMASSPILAKMVVFGSRQGPQQTLDKRNGCFCFAKFLELSVATVARFS